jgi:uncharacterized protein YjiS (DUF1127 family)
LKETIMRTNFPLVPIAAAAPARAFAALAGLVASGLRALVRARRHRAEVRVLAEVDPRMLADLGITRADLRDAFSEPFWEDPTSLLRERALERRLGRRPNRAEKHPEAAEFNRALRHAPADRPVRQTI